MVSAGLPGETRPAPHPRRNIDLRPTYSEWDGPI
jgi:hypothetical protein